MSSCELALARTPSGCSTLTPSGAGTFFSAVQPAGTLMAKGPDPAVPTKCVVPIVLGLLEPDECAITKPTAAARSASAATSSVRRRSLLSRALRAGEAAAAG
jgi:hypothetical protein